MTYLNPTPAEQKETKVLICKACTLADYMKTCKICAFRVGLENSENKESKMKYNANIMLRKLQDEKYYLVQQDSELAEVLGYVGLKEEYKENITGAVLLVGDGDYIAVWLTESSAFYSLHAIYHPLPYYKDDESKENNIYLPEYWQEENPEYNTKES